MTSTEQYTSFQAHTDPNQRYISLKQDVYNRARRICTRVKTHSVHSSMVMNTAGFKYTGEGDTSRCDTCQLEVSEWTQNMAPFSIHAERSPQCEFVRSRMSKSSSQSDNQENLAKRQKSESSISQVKHNCRFMEVKQMKQIRRRTFSHWPHRAKPSVEQMIAAGFFSCNVGDRVICLYCNLICQQWSVDDDALDAHSIISSQCPYVLSMLTYPQPSTILILNESSVNNQTHGLTDPTQHQFNEIVYTTSCHSSYSNITKRLESFRTWSQESSPSVEELARAGFFYTGTSTVVTCFYCNGSLQNWSTNDKPVIEHARWFQHCPYAKQLCGDELYNKIQEAKQAQRERERNNASCLSNQRQLSINDPNTLSRFVAARLDLPISQNLLNLNFKSSVIKRCWEDQLRLKHNDFVSDSDLLICCIILQKQIDHIQGDKKNIIVPSVQLKLLREKKQSDILQSSKPSDANNTEVMDTQPAATTSPLESTMTKQSPEISETNLAKNTSISNPCIICCQDEKRLACIPCGHFTTCVSCSHALRTCPVCRREIEAFVRIYI